MKIVILVCLGLFSAAEAATWVEILKESDFHENHPGRHAREITPNSPGLTYLEKRREVLEQILEGSPARIPIEIPELEEWTHMMISQADLTRLTKFHAEQQEWDEVFKLLALGSRVKNRLIESEPTFIWLLIAISHGNTSFAILESLSKIEDPEKRREIFVKLRRHWQQSRTSRMDFLKSQKGQTRYVTEMTKDFKTYLRSTIPDLDKTPWFWKDNAPHEITPREFLKFPIDATETRKRYLADLQEEFDWVRSDKPLADLPRLTKKVEPRDLDFYRNHPNGLFELLYVNDDNGRAGIVESINHQLKHSLLKEIAWRWLEEESKGKQLSRESDVLNLLSPAQKKEALQFRVAVSPNNRTVSTPPTKIIGFDSKNVTKVPNLFPN